MTGMPQKMLDYLVLFELDVGFDGEWVESCTGCA